MKNFIIEISYQPINNCWGAMIKNNNLIFCEVDENLNIVLEKIAGIIKLLQEKGRIVDGKIIK